MTWMSLDVGILPHTDLVARLHPLTKVIPHAMGEVTRLNVVILDTDLRESIRW